MKNVLEKIGNYKPLSRLDEDTEENRDIRLALRKQIGIALREARKARGISSRELEEICGIAFNHICRIEGGRYNVTLDTLSLITKALGVEIRVVDPLRPDKKE